MLLWNVRNFEKEIKSKQKINLLTPLTRQTIYNLEA